MSKKTAQVIIRKGNRGHNRTSMFYLPNTGQHFKSWAKQRTLTQRFTDAGMQTSSLKLTGRSTTVTVCNFHWEFLEADCHSQKHKSTDPSTVTLLNVNHDCYVKSVRVYSKKRQNNPPPLLFSNLFYRTRNAQ